MRLSVIVCVCVASRVVLGADAPQTRLVPADVFALEYASDPRISPDSEHVVYTRRSGDIMTDRFRSSVWIVGADGSGHRALVQGAGNYSAPRWSPSGDRVLFSASEDGHDALRVLFMDTKQITTLAELPSGASGAAWSPDGTRVVFSMFTAGEGPAPVAMPKKPEGAQWAKPAVVIDAVRYRFDGQGYLEPGSDEVYVLPAEGGTPRRLTFTEADISGPFVWAPDGASVFLSANLTDPDFDPIESEVYQLDVETGELTALTDRDGPDAEPALSPDGGKVAYVGFTDRERGYQVQTLSVLDRATGKTRELAGGLDRSVSAPVWGSGGDWVYFQFDDHGVTKIGRAAWALWAGRRRAVPVLAGPGRVCRAQGPRRGRRVPRRAPRSAGVWRRARRARSVSASVFRRRCPGPRECPRLNAGAAAAFSVPGTSGPRTGGST